MNRKSTPSNAKDNWNIVLDRTLCELRRQKISLPKEWEDFSDDEVNFLSMLRNEKETFDSIIKTIDILSLARNGSIDFLEQCVVTSLGKKCCKLEAKFLPYFNTIYEWIKSENVKIPGYMCFDDIVLLHLVEVENLEALKAVLIIINESSNQEIQQSDVELERDHNQKRQNNSTEAYNNSAHMRACAKRNYKMIQLFVSYGYRLSCREQLCSLGNNFNGSDILNRIKALRSMTTSEYIIARYMDVADNHDVLKQDAIYQCTCKYGEICDEFHYCPSSEKFEARGYCSQHVECVDPITRCFDLDLWAKHASQTYPEYKNECQQIADDANEFAVQLLDQCSNSCEVDLLLSERSGASRYFRYSYAIKYARLYQAIEHNRKEFVGHMYCQQMLRDQWCGGINWKEKSISFTMAYYMFLLLLFPIHCLLYYLNFVFSAFGETPRQSTSANKKRTDIYVENGIVKEDPDTREGEKYSCCTIDDRHKTTENDTAEEHGNDGCSKKFGIWFKKASSFYLGVPFNRFLLNSISYGIFVCIVITLSAQYILRQNSNYHTKHRHLIQWSTCHTLLSTFVSSMLLSDILSSIVIKKKPFSGFWRIYDLILHIFLGFYLILYLTLSILSQRKHCNLEDEKELAQNTNSELSQGTNSTLEADSMVYPCKALELPNSICEVMFAIGATMTILRIGYWLQLGETIGPVIINITRIMKDILAIASSYFVILFAFSFGMLFLLTLQLSSYRRRMGILRDNSTMSSLLNASSNPSPNDHLEFTFTMFWAVLNPGPFDVISHASIEGISATCLSIVYQILIVIILLNLLIAVMNSTMQNVNHNKILYWKYHRSSVWIHFFNDAWALPPPFSLLVSVSYVIGVFVTMFNNLSMRCSKKRKQSFKKNCVFNRLELEKRQAHMSLMKELINRYMITKGISKDDKTWQK